jgi:hypothetical protein
VGPSTIRREWVGYLGASNRILDMVVPGCRDNAKALLAKL